jgi:ubiquinone/menaquinone biosynthesis C-methylase UbiE
MFACASCDRRYPVVDEVPQFDLPTSPDAGSATGERDERRDYWDHGWQARIQGDHAFQAKLETRQDWSAYLEREIEILGESRHVMVVEANRATVQNKVVLDIGCGSGTSGALFGYLGARFIGVDHSRHAAAQALRNLRAAGGEGFTAQGNAEALPLRDGSVDVVYSNGVLHHTPNFLTAVSEAYRVLKPGGKAIIALYATYSTQFGVTRLLGVLKGHVTRKAQTRWMAQASEGAWRTGTRLNPWTQTFSKAQLREVMRKYSPLQLRIRKNGHPIGDFPRYGPRLMRFTPIRALDRLLEPTLGSMLVVSFDKDPAAPASVAR